MAEQQRALADGLALLDAAQLRELSDRAAAEPRGRAHFLLHAGADDPVQRLMIAAQGRQRRKELRCRHQFRNFTIGIALARDRAPSEAQFVAVEVGIGMA
jgi:hypothetical protein